MNHTNNCAKYLTNLHEFLKILKCKGFFFLHFMGDEILVQVVLQDHKLFFLCRSDAKTQNPERKKNNPKNPKSFPVKKEMC
jgi:DNA modification methylase